MDRGCKRNGLQTWESTENRNSYGRVRALSCECPEKVMIPAIIQFPLKDGTTLTHVN